MESTFSAPRLSVDVVADPSCVPFLSSVTKTFLIMSAGLEEESEAFSHLRIAIVEAVTNVVRHAYRGRDPGPLQLELVATPGWISARLWDRGVPFDATKEATLPDPKELAEGGYGRGIVQSVMDEFTYDHRPDTGNVFTMRKRVPVVTGVAGERR